MSRFEEIVIESDDNEDKISEEGFMDDQMPGKAEYNDIKIEAIEQEFPILNEDKLVLDENFERRSRTRARLIEELMIEDMDIQNEQYVLKKVKDSSKQGPSENLTKENLGSNLNNATGDAELKTLENDIPERIQLLYGSKPLKISDEELEVEAKWICRRLEKKKKMSLDYDSDQLVTQIMIVLGLLKNQYFEVMYIHTYKFNEIPDLTLEDLWFIQNRDLEWVQIIKKKAHLHELNEQKITHEPTRSYIDNLITNSFDEYTIDNISGYIQFKEKILQPSQSELQFPNMANLNINEVYADPELRDVFFECLSEIFVTPEDFAYNLKHNNLIKIPKKVPIKPSNYFQAKKATSGLSASNFMEDLMSFYKTITFMMAYELYFHPLVKAFSRRIYLEKVKISTRPKARTTVDLASKIDIYKPDYCVKRIKNRPFTQFKADETGIYLLKNATEGKIDSCFHTSDEIIDIFNLNALSPDKDGMLKHLVNHFISNSTEDEFAPEWNLIRKECINFLVHHLLYPSLQKELEKDILETSEKSIINKCTEKLRYIVNNGPCMSSVKEGEHATIMSIVLTDQKQIIAVVVDSDGNMKSTSPKLNHESFKMMNSQQTINQIDSNKKEEYQQLSDFIVQNRPEIIVLGDYRISRRIIRKIVRDRQDCSFTEELANNIIYCSVEIPKLLLQAPDTGLWNDPRPQNLEDNIDDENEKIALYLARLQQDALNEVCKLWSEKIEENFVLNILLHELQPYITKTKLMQSYRELLLEIVNKNGVDLNHMLRINKRAAPLQFICGLGPIRANYFLKKEQANDGLPIKQRNLLFRYDKYCFQDKTFWNACGFIFFKPPKDDPNSDDYKYLDQTRLSPQWYTLARKIEKDTFEDVSEDLKSIFEKAQNYPDLLREVDLDDFAIHLESTKGMKNMKPILEFIVSEFMNPFQTGRAKFCEWKHPYLFFAMTGLAPSFCKVGSIVHAVITKTAPTLLSVKVEGGIETTIYKYEIYEKDNNIDLTKEFFEGQTIVARIMTLNYEHLKTDFSSLVKMSLTLKPTILNNHKDYILELHPNLDEFNVVDPNDDYPVLISNKRKKSNFTDRMIMHNKFKNITAEEAILLLEDKDAGEFLFRPGKRPDRIFITWKFFDHIYTNVEIYEGERHSTEPISKALMINRKTFSSLNEIIAHYIQPCNKLVKAVTHHSKFFRGDLNTILQQLRMEKEAEPKYIPYHFLFSKDVPEHVLLCYLKNEKLVVEYIKIDGSGFYFHDALFVVFEELIRFFKREQNKPDYISYIESSKKPLVELLYDEDEDHGPSRSLTSGFGIETMKWRDMQKVTLEEMDRLPDQDSIKIKQEKGVAPICEQCGSKGHQAMMCPVLDNSGYSRRKRDTWNTEPRQTTSVQKSSDGGWGNNGGDSWGQSEVVQDTAPDWGPAESNDNAWGDSSSKNEGKASWGQQNDSSDLWGSTGETNQKPSWGQSKGNDDDAGDSKPRNKGCFNCGEEGHRASDCPQPKKERQKFACFNCGEEGHRSSDCPQPKKERQGGPRGKMECYNCGEEGHGSRDCPQPKKERQGGPRGTLTCYNCGEEGHGSRNCPQPKKERQGGPRGKMECFKCGEEGHRASDCPNPNKNPGGGRPRRRDNSRSRSRSNEKENSRKPGGWGDSSNNDQWGPAGQSTTKSSDTWGEPSKNESQSVPINDSWGVGPSGGFGETKPQTVADSWGEPPKADTEPVNNDSWGKTKANTSTWNEPSKNETTSAPLNDSTWGEASKTQTQTVNNDLWGESSKPAASNDSWGEPSKNETKPQPIADTWGEPPKSQTRTTNNDSWGESSRPAASNDSWGESSKPAASSNSWGESSKPAASNDSWGSSKEEKKEASSNAWGNSGTDSWGGSTSWGKSDDSNSGSKWGGQSESSRQGRRNNDDGGDSKPRNRGCFNCGEEGHRASDCPQPKKERQKFACFNCGEEGHRSSDCPQPKKERQGGPRGKMECYNCGEEGHGSRDCPQPKKERQGGPRGKMECYNCGEEGHRSSECPNPKKERQGGQEGSRGKLTCYNCGEEGHGSRNCPQPKKERQEGSRGKLTCYNCGEEGHGSRNCPQPKKERQGGPRGKMECYKCGEEGHRAAECPNPGGGSRPGRRDDSRNRSRSREKSSSSRRSGDCWKTSDDSWGKSGSGWGESSSKAATGDWGAPSNQSAVQDTWDVKGKTEPAKNQKETDMTEEEGQIGTWDNKKVKPPKTDNSWGNQNSNVKGSDTWGNDNEPKKSEDTWGDEKKTDNESKKSEDTWGNQNTATDKW